MRNLIIIFYIFTFVITLRADINSVVYSDEDSVSIGATYQNDVSATASWVNNINLSHSDSNGSASGTSQQNSIGLNTLTSLDFVSTLNSSITVNGDFVESSAYHVVQFVLTKPCICTVIGGFTSSFFRFSYGQFTLGTNYTNGGNASIFNFGVGDYTDGRAITNPPGTYSTTLGPGPYSLSARAVSGHVFYLPRTSSASANVIFHLYEIGSAIPPTVVTQDATNVTASTATLNGAVDPNAYATSADFQYGPTIGSMNSLINAALSPNSSTLFVPVSANLSGSNVPPVCFYRLVATNANGTTIGEVKSFKLGSDSSPTVATEPVTNITTTTATLNASIDPNGSATKAYVEYWTPNTDDTRNISLAQSLTAQEISVPLSDLIPDTVYQWRVVASNAVGTTITAGPNFKTGSSAYITFFSEPYYDTTFLSGHAFLQMASKSGASAYYGFFPTTNFYHSIGRVDSTPPSWTWGIAYPVTDVQYRSAAAAITHDCVTPPDYDLRSFNCMDWIAKIATVANLVLPPHSDSFGVSDPRSFSVSLANLGAGANYNGGTVLNNGNPNSLKMASTMVNQAPYDYSYSLIESNAHADASQVAASLGLVSDSHDLGTVNASSANGFTIKVIGVAVDSALISMQWGDGSNNEGQALSFTHVYAAGTYSAQLLVVDGGAIHTYSMKVAVSDMAASQININVSQFPSVNIPNQGFTGSNPVPNFAVMQTTSFSVLSNGHALIQFNGVPNWTYTIQTSNDLTEFQNAWSVTADANGNFQYDDPSANGARRRFYRATYP